MRRSASSAALKPVVVFGCYLLSGLKITQLDRAQRQCLQIVSGAVRTHPCLSRNVAQLSIETWVCFFLTLPDTPWSTLCKLLNRLIAAPVFHLMSPKGPVHPNYNFFFFTIPLAVYSSADTTLVCDFMMSLISVFFKPELGGDVVRSAVG